MVPIGIDDLQIVQDGLSLLYFVSVGSACKVPRPCVHCILQEVTRHRSSCFVRAPQHGVFDGVCFLTLGTEVRKG